MFAIHERTHADIQITAGRDDRTAAGPCSVDQFPRTDGDGIAVDAPEVVDAACVDVGRAAVDEARVREAVGDVDGVVASGKQLAAGLVVERVGRDGEVAASADGGAVVHVAADRHRQVAAGGEVAGLVERSGVGEGQVLRGLQQAQALQRLDRDREAFAGQQLALVVLQHCGLDGRVALSGDVSAGVVQLAGIQRQVLARADGAGLVVDATGDDGGRLGQHAFGRDACGGQRGAVVQAGGVQGQGVVGLNQAALIVDSAGRNQGEIRARQRAAGIADARGIDACIARGGDQAGGVIQFAAQFDDCLAGRRDLAVLIAQVGGGDVDAAAVQDGIARGDVARGREPELADGRDVAAGQVHAACGQGHVLAGRADARVRDKGCGQVDAAGQAERAVVADAGDEAAAVIQRVLRRGGDVATREHRAGVVQARV
ncbi:hypothetical protein LMG26685_05203 [Achromobacter mucicolens]|nr:hypothetical protein LMG26685_05203 [Achromobacter mucicolens]